VLAHRRLPHTQLFFQAGARMDWRPGPGAYFPAVDAEGRTSVPGLFAVGPARDASENDPGSSSERTVEAILAEPRAAVPSPSAGPDGTNELVSYYRELLKEPRHGKWVACPCEDVLLEDVEEASRAGFRGVEVIKRYTGLGTGLCQGRYCLPDALLLLSVLEERPPPQVGYITQRPPVVPTPLSALSALAETFRAETDA
jgi:sarcosine oxidase alpha subunit family protein